ncbi:hypothetical protein Acr_08g0009120 [Actinidia rufa]|uniref:WRC domain-containing protein n=1 Tax=Actinidia rufa TaxID=165716 RepID=A0A7J0F243_9ERIC|nr:hypothetical protein Acr_08g0009120 [Actinidia rufa]
MCSADLLSPPAARHTSTATSISRRGTLSPSLPIPPPLLIRSMETKTVSPQMRAYPIPSEPSRDSQFYCSKIGGEFRSLHGWFSCSVASMKISVDGEDKNVNNQPPNHALSMEEDMEKVICCKTDGKAWKCKKETSRGHPLCEHHLAQIRTYNSLAHPLSGKKSVAAPEKAAASTRRPRLKKSGSNSNLNPNPQEFYYYSGFGPRWGKKRGSNNPVNNNNKVRLQEFEEGAAPSSSSSQIDHDLCDYVEDDYDEEEDEFGKKRGRKPIKARSLKSLM